MNETKILEHVALMTRLNEQGVRAETTKQTRKALADQYGVRIPVNQTPLNERESWTLNSAAKVWNIDYHALLIAAEHRLSPALVGPDQQENQTGEREDQARDADDSVAHAYSSNWAMNSSIALRVTRRQLLVPRRLGGRNVVRVPLFAAMSSA